MDKEEEYFHKRLGQRLYVSKRFYGKFGGISAKRFITKKHEVETQVMFEKKGSEIILSENPTRRGTYQLKALIHESSKLVKELVIQRFTAETGSPHKNAFSFRGGEIENLYLFLKAIKELELPSEDRITIDDVDLSKILLSQQQARQLIKDHTGAIVQAIKNDVSIADIVSIAYKKEQLKIFERLLNDDEFFKSEMQRIETKSEEGLWQMFFEQNTWIFGYGLEFIFNSPLEEKKLEQVVDGYSIKSKGKRIDALLKSRGLISSLCFCEIKIHSTVLLRQVKNSYRPESWAISSELAGAISQVHKTVQKSLQNLGQRLETKDDQGNLSGEEIFIYNPKSFVIIGSLQEFDGDHGINQDKYSSFEIFRKNQINPEIITFDELYERAKFIVDNSIGTKN